jgi:tRNA A-37 threonylcarbamoyl transferase component Bud32
MPEETDAVLRLVRTVREDGRVSIRRMGSFVNDVFLVKVDSERFVAKRYTNWVSLKWVTLSLYGLGSVRFSISGKRRMEAEYYFNDLLYRRGLKVPRILGADSRARIVLFSYIPGDQLSSLLGPFAGLPQAGPREKDGANSAGILVAGAHQQEVALGDTKPENFIVDRKGNATLVDLEQGRFRGDVSWDVAEFLYYSGHYWLTYGRDLASFVDAFIEGYSEHGENRVLKSAASPKYVRVFSIWTPPLIINSIRKRLLNPGAE